MIVGRTAKNPTGPHARRCRAVAALLVVCVVGCAAQPGAESDENLDAKAEIQELLEAYLPALGRAYASGDMEPLHQWAVEKEIGHIRKRVSDLVEQGLILEPELEKVVVDGVDVWSYSNAFATTIETWNLRYYSTGSRSLVSEQLAQHNRVKYQLKRDGRRWWVLYRELEQTYED